MRFRAASALLLCAAALGCRGPSSSEAPAESIGAEPTAPAAPSTGEPAAPTAAPQPTADATSSAGARVTPSNVRARADEVVRALQARDVEALAALAHPRGVRFSPYPYVEIGSDRVLSPSMLTSVPTDTRIHTWGSFDGSGEPIRKTAAQYFARFVWDANFARAKQVSIDKPISYGNTLDNSRAAYPRARIVEYYLPGSDPPSGGMDWRSLRLVFERENDRWWLVGVIHGEWTI